MSINVTVTGNPVSIKRGSMVTADPNHAKKEFDKRRLLRLEQVRQQSKDIAEDVRNKVRKERQKQESEIEEEGKQKLKNWQNRKLLELQTQYKEALRELGAGHKEAKALEDESEVVAERKEQNEKRASDRGRLAASKLQIEKNKTNFKKSIPLQQKKLVRDIENTRAALVSNIKKKKTTIGKSNQKKRKKASADISIIIPESPPESESEESRELNGEEISEDRLSNIAKEQQATSSSYETTGDSENTQISVDSNENHIAPNLRNQESMKQFEPPGPKPSLNIEQSTNKVPYAQLIRERSIRNVIPLDTRISDRIRRREIMAPQLDYCDIVAETNPCPFIKSNTQISDAIESRYSNRGPNIVCLCGKKRVKCFCEQGLKANGPSNMCCTCGKNQVKCFCGPNGLSNMCTCGKTQIKCIFCTQGLKESGTSSICTCQNIQQCKCAKVRKSQSTSLPHRKSRDFPTHEEIPTKPPIKLKESGDLGRKDIPPSRITLESMDSRKVQYYDHANRFSQEKITNSHVEKIATDSIEVLPNDMSQVEWYEKMKQRDREAQMRGQRALEKGKIRKDYEDMVKKLPLLQKKERMCEINKDKPEFHMTEERLMERERKKQNNLDNAYTKLFPNLRPAMVTLPRKKHEADARIGPGDEEPTQSLNVAKWDVDCEEPKMFTIEEVQEIIKAFTGQKPKDRRAKLKELLSSLRVQKEQLLDEIRCLPRDESINALIDDLNSVSDSGRTRKRDRTCKRKRCQEENEKETSTDSTTESSSSTSDSKPQRRRRCKFTVGRCPGEYGKTPSPRKKAKMKPRRSVLILQNTSTQTTPKTVLSTSPHQDKAKETEEPQKKPKEQSSVIICNKLHAPCDCNKENVDSAEELCQIVIKLNDNEEPEVVVKAKEKEHQISDKMSKTKQRSPSPIIEKKIVSKSIAIGTDEVTRISLKEMVEERRMPSKERPASPSGAVEQTKKETRKVTTDKVKSRRDQPPPPPGERSDFKAKSWREQLSKNSLSSASTSYLSPPNFQATIDQTISSRAESTRHSFYDLRKKPQQGNLYDVSQLSVSPSQSPAEERTIDPTLLAYIKKLLSMSRDSVDNLTVSTSNVQTPSQSIVEMDSNNPLAQLHNLLRYFNLKVEDIARELSYSPDASPMHYNASSSASEASLRQQRPEQKKSGHIAVQSPKSSSSDKHSSAHSIKSTHSIMAQYTDVTDSCSKRIANLTSMIQQIREEKLEMLQNPPGSIAETKSGNPSPAASEQDISTGYLDLPGSKEGSRHSSANSSDEEIHRRLLEIDLTLANKLRKFTPLTDNPILEEQESRRDLAGPSKEASDDATDELWMRLKRLTQAVELQPHVVTITESPKTDNQSFVPFLSDIPKLPKLEAQPVVKFDLSNNHRRPPPSKGLTVAKKFNGDILLVPHELSTIAEADSLVSTRMGSNSVSPNTSKTSQTVTPRKDLVEVVSKHEHQGSQSLSSSKSSKSSRTKSPVASITFKDTRSDDQNGRYSETDRSKSSKSGTPSRYSLSVDISSKSKTSGDASLNKSMTAVSKKSLLVSSSSSDDLESIEAMLRSIGMEWAIPTLHKTHEALALTSSSSSQDVSGKQISKGNNSTGSEITLKDFLSKQMINKVSSSSLNSDASPASFSLEFSDLSAIQLHSGENKGKRTSTPVTSSASKSKGSLKQVIFSNGSDISSVNDYDNQSFHSLSEHSHSKNGG